jgi:hypothetical protein
MMVVQVVAVLVLLVPIEDLLQAQMVEMEEHSHHSQDQFYLQHYQHQHKMLIQTMEEHHGLQQQLTLLH